MPRALSTGERAQLEAAHAIDYEWWEVENGAGDFVSLTDVDVGGGVTVDFTIASDWGSDIDDPVTNGTLTVLTEVVYDGSVYSLAPFLSGSPLNTDGTGYSPLLLGGRLLKGYVATVAPGTTRAAAMAVRRPIVEAKLTDVPDAGGRITVAWGDLGAYLMVTEIEEEEEQGSAEGTPVEDVQQALLTRWISRLGPVTLVVDDPASTLDFSITTYRQSRGGNVMLAVRDLTLNTIGWDTRYRWNGADEFRFTLFDPDRTKSVPDFTLGPNQYFYRPALSASDRDVVNVPRVWFRNDDTGALDFRDGTPPAGSLQAFGRRFRQVDFTAALHVRTPATAQRLADAIAHDVGDLFAEFSIETRYRWDVEVFDLGEFPSNGLTHDATQTFGVVRVRHTRTGTQRRTRIECRGHVAGAYQNWLDRMGRGIAPSAIGLPQPILGPLLTEASADGGAAPGGALWLPFQFVNERTNRVRCFATTGPDPGLPEPQRDTMNTAMEIQRLEGSVCSVPNFQGIAMFETIAQYWKTLVVEPRGPGDTIGIVFKAERQATDGGIAISLPVVPDVQITREGSRVSITWGAAASPTPPTGYTVHDAIWRAGLVIAWWPEATSPLAFVEDDILSAQAADYQVFKFCTNWLTNFLSGERYGETAPTAPTEGRPEWVGDSPDTEYDPLFNRQAVRIEWTLDNPAAAYVDVWRYGLAYADTGGAAPPPVGHWAGFYPQWKRVHRETGVTVAGGVVFLPDLTSGTYELRAIAADGVTVLAASEAREYRNPMGGSGVFL